MNISNSTGYSHNLTTITGITLNANSNVSVEFVNVNTTNWTADNFTLSATAVGNFTRANNRTENLVFNDVSVYTKAIDYVCNSITEEFYVTIFNPFTDNVGYGVYLDVPAGWSYSGAQSVNLDNIGNKTLAFNITSSSSAAENVTITAAINYTYPDVLKQRNSSQAIQESNSLPILEITRETPLTTAGNRVFESQLTIHNIGCGTASSAVVQEQLSTGWTPANPNIKTNQYGTDISLTSSSTDLENNVITWNLGSIPQNRYSVLTYQIKSPTTTATLGDLHFNSSWDGRTENESSLFTIQTLNYTSEAHLEFDLTANQQAAAPSPEVRSAQPNVTYNYTLTVINIGDLNATGWNITLTVPQQCNVPSVFQNGTYDDNAKLINWPLSTLEAKPSAQASTTLNATFNCTDTRSYALLAKGIKDNTTTTSFTNSTGNIGCGFTSGTSCAGVTNFNFSKPGNARYETLSNVNFTIFYNWTGFKTTIGQGFVNISDDDGNEKIIWQNYSLLDSGTSGTITANYTMNGSEGNAFVDSLRSIGVNAEVDSTSAPKGNVTVQKITYTWNHGKNFSEPQNLYINVKTYTYSPLLSNATLYINNTAKNSSNSSSDKTGGWGEQFNFSVDVGDRFNRNVTVFAWHKLGAGSYELIDSFVCESCSLYKQINFTYDYVGDNISSADGWTFKFNATNADGSSELSGFTYTVEKDDINTDYIAPNNEVNINRSGNATLSVRSFDRDLGVYPNGSSEAVGKIYISVITIDNFESSPSTISANNGFFNRTVTNAQWCADTTSYYLGKHAWYGGTENSDFVKDNLTLNYLGSRNFTLVGSLANTMNTPNGATNYTRGNAISFTGSVVDDCSASQTASSTIVYNISQGSTWFTCTADATGACSIPTNSSVPLGFYNVTMTSNKSGYNNGYQTNQSLFFLGTVSQLDQPRKEPTTVVVPWGNSPLRFVVNVTDVDNNTVNASLWIKNTTANIYILENSTTCTNCNNYIFNTSKNFTFAAIAANTWTFKFNSTDSGSIGTNETIETTFNITTDTITFFSFGNNNTIVNRSSSGLNNVRNLSTFVFDIILNANTLNPTTPNLSGSFT